MILYPDYTQTQSGRKTFAFIWIAVALYIKHTEQIKLKLLVLEPGEKSMRV